MESSIPSEASAVHLAKSKTTRDIGEGAALRRGSRPRRRSASVDVEKFKELEVAEDEDPELRDERGYRGIRAFNVSQLLTLAYKSVGVIYGDISTSPLYVFSSTFTEPPKRMDLLGAVSLIIWSLTIIVTFKYVLLVLRADNDGEGGSFSTYALLSRYANISQRDPREASMVRTSRVLFSRSTKHVRSTIEKTRFFRGLLQIIGVLAVSMIIADGVLTPAQSVLAAVQGLEVASDDVSRSTIIGVTCAILVLLFLAQPFGTSRFSVVFTPIVSVWLALNAGFGIYNLTRYDHGMLKAFNPYYAFDFLIRNGHHGWRSLGGILLCFTGVEVLFAGIGPFSRQAIQVSWIGYVYPCLLLAYVGQGAYISQHPEAYINPFYNCAPLGWLIPSLVIAIGAAAVASQTMITATFQLLTQIMKLSYFPQIQVVHTSKTYYGQVYVPLANWLLMVGTVLVAAIYNNSASLGNAYGVCVMFVTFFDTCLVTLVAILVWRVKPYYVFLPWLIIASFDGTFLTSALTKAPDGAWFTIVLACLLACIFILWRFGKEQQWLTEAKDRFPTTHFIKTNGDGSMQLTDAFGGRSLASTQGFGVFFDKVGETTPIVFSQFIRKLSTVPEVIVFFHLRPIETPSVPLGERYHVTRLAIPNCYRLVVRHGYMDEVITPDLAALIYEKVRHHVVSRDMSKNQPSSTTTSRKLSRDLLDREHTHTVDKASTVKDAAEGEVQNLSLSSRSRQNPTQPPYAVKTYARLQALERAFKHEVLYIIGKEQMKIKSGTNMWRTVLLKTFLFLRDNTRAKIGSLSVPMDKVIEVGFVKEV
ncbi:potassium transporter [Dothidotthia symphoricarpi CBS 119687]|uniref:Potassium transporter n=1 Tax=Dothidotthia symphoricarpi CBS 119687 TaxID=1392245 RepID=A0A6A6ADA2_9PLEO|nr:potassium transporter [Dothidotthia symphoricarpi CBS 119687]KAF2129243.1 potassium transporter [Dothidotthia symphoricarpi CBS 119687]